MKILRVTIFLFSMILFGCSDDEESRITISNKFQEDAQAYICSGSDPCGFLGNDFFINVPTDETRSQDVPNGTYSILIGARFSEDEIEFRQVFSVDNENYTITYFGE